MPATDRGTSRRILEPTERLSEILFGLIMVLSFTGSLSAATAGREEIRTMLFGAIGCNLAWGIVDAVMYVMASLLERGRSRSLLQSLRRESPAGARRVLADALPSALAARMEPPELDRLREKLVALPDPPPPGRPIADDLRGAAGVFLLVFLSTFPVVVPFIVMQDPVRALRFSNAVAIVLLFLLGYRLGRSVGGRPIRLGLAMVAIGLVLVAVTIALGG